MTKEFYSNGKLLLSGEYAVLDGATAWAIPTKFGQYLRISTNKSGQIRWKSIDEKGRPWFQAVYTQNGFDEVSSSEKSISKSLQKILKESQKLKPGFLTNHNGYEVETELTFNKNWGLGSSSTLINNIADWASIDAYQLLENTFGGSGYDIACAQFDTPILYQRDKSPKAVELTHKMPFAEQIYFVYLNKKKNSREAIEAYRQCEIDKQALAHELSQISKRMIISQHLEEFEGLILQHENLLSTALGIPTVKSVLFSDYAGQIKSLGAWGGDFILATGNEESPAYFKKKGYSTVIAYTEMLL